MSMDKCSNRCKKCLIILLSVCILILIHPIHFLAKAHTEQEVSSEKILEYIEGIIHWKKNSLDISDDDPLFNHLFLQNAGDTTGDWYPIGMGRIGYPDEYEKYLAVIQDVVEERYERKNKLSKSKATEWHRISLAILASGGDPTKAGIDGDGEVINLISDGTYDRGKTSSLGTQGLNGWIWGLITLDSMRYTVPDEAYDTRKSMIEQILKAQLPNGGFSLNSPEPDADMTAMAIQALAPYYNSEEKYTYTNHANEKVKKTVREVVDEALETLSELQLETGDYGSVGIPNAESTAQVIVALTSLGIDPVNDERFIKNGNTLFQGMMTYLMDDGGFIHSKSYDPENPTSLPDESNTMASEQILYSLVSLYRFYENHRTLYDFREEMSEKLQEEINSVKQSIDSIPEKVTAADKSLIENIFQDYVTIPVEERSYVYNYDQLADAMEELKMENTSEPIAENIGMNNGGIGSTISPFDHDVASNFEGIFTKEHAKAAEAIPDEVTTEYYVEVISYINMLEQATNKDAYRELLESLKRKKEKIELIEKEIESLNQDMISQLYPFDDLGIKDKEKVEKIIDRYNALSPYDQQKIQSFSEVERASTKMNNMVRTRVIFVGLFLLIGMTSFFFIKSRRKRKKAKSKQKMFYEEG